MEKLELKKELSEELVGKTESSVEEKVKGLSEAFNVPEEEALQTLQECGNDLKMAMKLLRMKNLEQ